MGGDIIIKGLVLQINSQSLKKFEAALEQVQIKMQQNAGVGLENAGKNILEYSNQLVPVDTGALRSSASVTKSFSNQSEVKTFIGYGDQQIANPKTGRLTSEYAVEVHENLEAQYKKGKTPKFLEIAALSKATQEFQTTVANALKRL